MPGLRFGPRHSRVGKPYRLGHIAARRPADSHSGRPAAPHPRHEPHASHSPCGESRCLSRQPLQAGRHGRGGARQKEPYRGLAAAGPVDPDLCPPRRIHRMKLLACVDLYLGHPLLRAILRNLGRQTVSLSAESETGYGEIRVAPHLYGRMQLAAQLHAVGRSRIHHARLIQRLPVMTCQPIAARYRLKQRSPAGSLLHKPAVRVVQHGRKGRHVPFAHSPVAPCVAIGRSEGSGLPLHSPDGSGHKPHRRIRRRSRRIRRSIIAAVLIIACGQRRQRHHAFQAMTGLRQVDAPPDSSPAPGHSRSRYSHFSSLLHLYHPF